MSHLHIGDPTPDVMLCAQSASCPDTISVTFLGVGGFVIRQAGSAVMTPPLFTRRKMTPAFLGFPYASDSVTVARGLRAHDAGDLRDVQMVFVGHSHYDHLLDVTSLAAGHLSEDAQIVGTPSMRHLLSSHQPSMRRLQVIEVADAGTSTTPGKWIYSRDRRWRAMALRSMHTRNFGPVLIAPDTARRDVALPTNAQEWVLGEVYAYVVDLLRDNGETAFRFFFQDAVSDAAYNRLPPLGGRDTVDLAIVVAGSFDGADDYPGSVLRNLNPRRVIVAHWENFFRSWCDRPTLIPFMKTRELRARLDDHARGRWVTPMPGTTLRYGIARVR